MAEKLESKLDYTIFLWGVFLIPFLVVPLIFLFSRSQQEFIPWNTAVYYFIAPGLVLTITAVIAWFYKKEVPKIIITPDRIYLGMKQISFGEIRKIDVLATGKNISEKSIIYLNNFDEIQILISLYGNGPLIRHNLNLIQQKISGQYVSNLPVFQTKSIQKIEDQPDATLKEYRQSVFKNYFIYFFLCYTSLFISFLIKYPQTQVFVLTGICLIVPSVVLKRQFYYFLLSEEHFTVRHIFMPWYQQTFHRSDIILAQKFLGLKGADGIKLILTDYSVQIFQSFLLSENMLDKILIKLNSTEFKVLK